MTTPWIDRLGGVASLTCAGHCALFAFAPALVALLGLEVLAHEALEWGFFAIALCFAAIAAAIGYRTHRDAWVPAGFLLGGLLLTAARLGEALSLFEGGAAVAVLGGGILLTSHVINTQRLRTCGDACCE